jgi:hypothetical protein
VFDFYALRSENMLLLCTSLLLLLPLPLLPLLLCPPLRLYFDVSISSEAFRAQSAFQPFHLPEAEEAEGGPPLSRHSRSFGFGTDQVGCGSHVPVVCSCFCTTS